MTTLTPTVSTVEVIEISVPGPQGAQGIQGVKGDTGATGPKGDTGLTSRGAWSSIATYLADDLVSYDGGVWLALATSTNVTPVEGASWSLALPAVSIGAGDVGTTELAAGGVTEVNLATALADKINGAVTASAGEFNVLDYGAGTSESEATNKTALQDAIDACDTAGGGVVLVPPGVNYGYTATSPSTHPDFTGTTADMMVLDRGPGSSYSSPARDGWQERRFYNTPQTSPVGQHDGNGFRVVADWHPYVWIDNNADYAAKGHASRTVNDNRRASVFFGNDGHATWQIMNGDTAGDLSEAEMNVFSIKSYNEDGTARHYPLIVNYATGNAAYGVGTTAPQAAHHFYQPSTSVGVGVAKFHTPLTEATVVLENASWSADLRLNSSGHIAFSTSIRTSGFVRSGAYATGARPDPAAVGAGGSIYDTTLGKPVWSNGSVWKDAAGTTV